MSQERLKVIERIYLRLALLANAEPRSPKLLPTLVLTWAEALREIPTNKLDICARLATHHPPATRREFGPWDLLVPWRENWRDEAGNQLRVVVG